MVLPVDSLAPLPGSSEHGLFGAAVHGVVQLDVLEAEIVLGLHRDGDFFDRGWRGNRGRDA